MTTAPRLNRIFTVSGASSEAVEGPIQWGSNVRLPDAFNLTTTMGAWYADAFAARGYALPDSNVLASQLVAFAPYQFGILNPTVSPDGTNQNDVPSLRDTLMNALDRRHWMRVETPDSGESYIEFEVIRITVFVDQPMITVVEVGQGRDGFAAPVLVGDDFALGPDQYVQFSFERHTALQAVETTFGRRVWGRLVERGSALGVLDITTSAPTVGASEETGSAIVRYSPDIAIGTALTDDLGRVWVIEGSRTINDRRHLEFSLARTVAALGG